MKNDLKEFMDLVKTDEALQKKLAEAASSYKGDQAEEAVFKNIIAPIAKDAGFSFTMDEYKQSVQELNPEEMEQVTGGGFGIGLAVTVCSTAGVGFGSGGGTDAYAGGCFLFGMGDGAMVCSGAGVTIDSEATDYYYNSNGQRY